MIDDRKFISRLNQISRSHGATLPALKRGESPSGEFLADWARFLENCVKQDIPLSDPRWQRVGVQDKTTYTHFMLELDDEDRQDSEFRVGLQLLMGILGNEDDGAA
ncbi:MAG: hypothetical protein V3V49_11435 [Candidatus Krumholzibacteria bacterium]